MRYTEKLLWILDENPAQRRGYNEEKVRENIDFVHHEDALIEMAKHEINEENLHIAIHILTGIYESDEPCGGYYIYDRCRGTLEDVTPITCKEDLEEYIDFEGEEDDD